MLACREFDAISSLVVPRKCHRLTFMEKGEADVSRMQLLLSQFLRQFWYEFRRMWEIYVNFCTGIPTELVDLCLI